MKKNNQPQEIIAIASKTIDGRDVKIKATITDGAINFKFNDIGIAKDFYWKERETNPKVVLFERLASFTEFHDGKKIPELKNMLKEKLEKHGLKDWTEKISDKIKKDLEKK